ncbi:hypothetical protein HDU83_002938 [Entophlyctis luteolus]|nr:hypothetical protein HDU83_002938 [Entophlyctis luteolus]
MPKPKPRFGHSNAPIDTPFDAEPFIPDNATEDNSNREEDSGLLRLQSSDSLLVDNYSNAAVGCTELQKSLCAETQPQSFLNTPAILRSVTSSTPKRSSQISYPVKRRESVSNSPQIRVSLISQYAQDLLAPRSSRSICTNSSDKTTSKHSSNLNSVLNSCSDVESLGGSKVSFADWKSKNSLHPSRPSATAKNNYLDPKSEILKGPKCLDDFADIHFEALQRFIGDPELKPRELVERIKICRENCLTACSNLKSFMDINAKICDLSLIRLVDKENLYGLKKRGLKKILARIQCLLYRSEDVTILRNSNLKTCDIPQVEKLPAPPEFIPTDDFVALAIHYHEIGQLEVSAYYLQKCVSTDENPLAIYLLALARRHGWGMSENKPKDAAFLDLLVSCEKLLVMVPPLLEAKSMEEQNAVSQNSLRVSVASHNIVKQLRKVNNASESLNSLARMWKFSCSFGGLSCISGVSKLMAVCFEQGWGIPKSAPAAQYFYKVSAVLGDVDAQYSLGYLFLKYGKKMEAAKWLRKAEAGGKPLPGESWVHKRKWGGTVD